MDNIKEDPRQNGLTRENAQDRARWERLIRPHIKVGEEEEEEAA